MQQEKPQRNIMATCAEILIRRKWGGTTSLLFRINLHRWTLVACHILVWHTEGVCLWQREKKYIAEGWRRERWEGWGERKEEEKNRGVEGAEWSFILGFYAASLCLSKDQSGRNNRLRYGFISETHGNFQVFFGSGRPRQSRTAWRNDTEVHIKAFIGRALIVK